jgi:aminopeptidase-like protein
MKKDYTELIRSYLTRLFPLTRSITGKGNRDTLNILEEIIPLDILEYPTGQKVYDWIIPREWEVKDAWVKNSKGKKIIDFSKSNLHLISYSQAIHKKMKIGELRKHLHFLKDKATAIPYRTTYYKEDWGFCLSYQDFKENFSNNDEIVEVFIDTDFKDGSLSIGELLIKGKSEKEYLISTYFCHPSMANDNLSGVILTAFLARELMAGQTNYSYRIIWVPETIGAITYCANNEKKMQEIDSGLVVTNVGGPGPFGYKQGFSLEHPVNRIIEQIFRQNDIDFITYPFNPHGSDERQYSSQGFRINTPSITKDKYYEYENYHTSLDNLDFVKPEQINQSLNLYCQVVDTLDMNIVYQSLSPNCEVMLSQHGLYPETGGGQVPSGEIENELDLILWLFFYCDGTKSLLEIAEILDVDMDKLFYVARKLETKGFFKRIS